MPKGLNFRITPAMYGSKSAAMDGVTSANLVIAPSQLENGIITVPSAVRHRDGRPRFMLDLPLAATRDVSALLLMAYEQNHYGFEAPYRLFLETHLAPGDVFIDIGAHWGTYTLSVATLALADVSILACEQAHAAQHAEIESSRWEGGNHSHGNRRCRRRSRDDAWQLNDMAPRDEHIAHTATANCACNHH